MKSINRPDYQKIRNSIINSIRTDYDNYKTLLKKYLDNTWYGDDGELCMMYGSDQYIKKSNEYLGKLSDDKRLLKLCNIVIKEEKPEDKLTENELLFLHKMNLLD